MYSGSGSSNMLYGGPLGAYLSGIYQPTSTALPSSSSSFSRRGSGSSRGYSGSGGSSNSHGSAFYTPQPRRKFGGHTHDASDGGRYTSSLLDPNPPSRTSTRLSPSSYSSSRPSSNYGSVNSLNRASPVDGDVDYKRLYEEEKKETDRIRADIEETKKCLAENKIWTEKLRADRKNASDQRRLERRMSEYEEEVKLYDKVKSESDKLSAENRALTRVVARLSRTP